MARVSGQRPGSQDIGQGLRTAARISGHWPGSQDSGQDLRTVARVSGQWPGSQDSGQGLRSADKGHRTVMRVQGTQFMGWRCTRQPRGRSKASLQTRGRSKSSLEQCE